MIVCSNSQTPPIQDVINELEALVPHGTPDPDPNNVTPDPNNTTQPTACESARSALESTFASADTSCQTDAGLHKSR